VQLTIIFAEYQTINFPTSTPSYYPSDIPSSYPSVHQATFQQQIYAWYQIFQVPILLPSLMLSKLSSYCPSLPFVPSGSPSHSPRNQPSDTLCSSPSFLPNIKPLIFQPQRLATILAISLPLIPVFTKPHSNNKFMHGTKFFIQVGSHLFLQAHRGCQTISRLMFKMIYSC